MPAKQFPFLRVISVVVLIGAAAWLIVPQLLGSPAPQAKRIILISIDTCRADHIGAYNPSRKDVTPNIDAFARGATLFRTATSAVPITLPAHSTILTGLLPPNHGVRSQPGYRLPEEYLTVTEILAKHDYRTGAVISADVLNHIYGLAQGFEEYDDQFRDPRSRGWGNERAGSEATDVAIEWLGRHHDDEKLFLFVHYYDPHLPYEAPEEFASRFGTDESGQYAAEVAYVDHCIGRLLDEIKRLGIYDDAMIIITADHGEMLREHGEYGHQFFIYQPAIQVPLLVKLPGQTNAREVIDPVGLVDLTPTIFSAAQTTGRPVMIDGRDLMGYLIDPDKVMPDRNRQLYCETLVPTQYGANPLYGLAGLKWKLIDGNDPQLYDLQTDPDEADNIYAQHVNLANGMSHELQTIAQTKPAADYTPVEGPAASGLGYVGGGPGDVYILPERGDARDLVRWHSIYQEAVLLAAAGQMDRALDLARQVTEAVPGVITPHVLLSRELSKLGQYEEALEHCDALINILLASMKANIAAKDPQSAAADSHNAGKEYAFRGGVHEQAGDTAKALVDYTEAIELDADSAKAILGKARLLASQGKPDQASEVLKTGLKHLKPGSAARREVEEALRLLHQ